MANRKEIIDEIILLAESYPNVEVADSMLGTYADVLEEYELDVIRKAKIEAIKKKKFFPTIAEFLEFMPESKKAAKKDLSKYSNCPDCYGNAAGWAFKFDSNGKRIGVDFTRRCKHENWTEQIEEGNT